MGEEISGLSGKVALDITDYKAGLVELNRNIRVLESGFRAQAASMGDWDKTANGLEKRIKALTDEYDLQKDKVILLTHEYKKIAAEKGANSRAAQDLQIRINKETESLNRMGNELTETKKTLKKTGEETKQTGKEIKTLGDKSDDAKRKTNGLKDALHALGNVGKITAKAIAGIAVGVVGVGLAIGGMIAKTTEACGELVDMSLKTSISVERLQELQYIGSAVGTDLDTMTSSMAKLTRSMSDVGSNKDITAAFKRLKVDVKDSTTGLLRDSEDVFNDLITALGTVSNDTERDALSMQILGKSAQELNPLIKAGGDELARLTAEAHKSGAVMSEETVANFEAFGDVVAGLKLSLKGTVGTMLGVFLPGLKTFSVVAQGYMEQFAAVVRNSNGDPAAMAAGIGDLLGRMISSLGKNLPGMMDTGLGILQGILDSIMQNFPVLLPALIQILTTLMTFLVQNLTMMVPMLIPAVIQILQAFIDFLSQNAPMLILAVIPLMSSLVMGILKMLPQLITTAVQIILALAKGLTQALPTLIPAVVAIIPQIVITLIENLPLLIDAALQLIIALATGLINAIPVLIPEIPKIVIAIVEALIKALPKIGEAALKLILALVDGIGKNLPKIGTAAGQIVGALIKGVKDLAVKLWDVGANLITGIWEGFKGRESWFDNKVKTFYSNIVGGIKGLLGIRSPSTVFASIGYNMAAGLGVGFEDQMTAVERNMRGAVKGLTFGGLSGFGGMQPQTASAPAAASMPAINVYASANNPIDYYLLAQRVAEEMMRKR